MIKFNSPPLEMSMTDYAQLPNLLSKSTSGIGLFISLGAKFANSGVREMDEKILPRLRSILGDAIPRVLPSYALLFWFTLEVLQCMSSHCVGDRWENCQKSELKYLTNINRYMVQTTYCGNFAQTAAVYTHNNPSYQITAVQTYVMLTDCKGSWPGKFLGRLVHLLWQHHDS